MEESTGIIQGVQLFPEEPRQNPPVPLVSTISPPALAAVQRVDEFGSPVIPGIDLSPGSGFSSPG